MGPLQTERYHYNLQNYAGMVLLNSTLRGIKTLPRVIDLCLPDSLDSLAYCPQR